MIPPAPALELAGIHKRFGSVHALRGADFTLAPREIHALLGENGAGKTTLVQVACGLVRPDGGGIRVGGKPARIRSPRDARRLGIGMVHQHFTAIPALTVAENVALVAGWPVAPGPLRRRVHELCERVGLPLDPESVAGELSIGLKQRLEIVKALAADATMLLLDEPTAVLAPGEVEELLRVVRRFTDAGGSAVLITHKLAEACAGADRVTVLRRGVVVHSGAVADIDAAALAAAMIGEDPGPIAIPGEAPAVSSRARPGSPALVRASALEVAWESGHGIAVRRAFLEVRGGEIVGVAAVEGNGQRELLRAVAGRLPPLRGRLEVAAPVGFVPEDRTTEGLIPELSLTENVVLGSGPGDPWVAGARIDWGRAGAGTEALLKEYRIAVPGPELAAAALSGGNQQRLVVARELARRPAVLVAENPTRGLDIRAAREIRAGLRGAAAGGAAVLFHSTDLDEVLALADRVIVMSRGSLIEAPSGASRSDVGALMLGGA
ncbi:MAG TPA: ATP-binding cassette domain-containing protein [Gemmatimonadales bacterium]|nr:ATP-binding cassette domain-containing protein [Gemmatimonadales bacterium]